MVLEEVSIIDERKIPLYEVTSIETRAEGKEMIRAEILEVRADVIEKKQENKCDLSSYKKRIKDLEER